MKKYTSRKCYIQLFYYKKHKTHIIVFLHYQEFKAIPSSVLSHFDPQKGFELTYRNISDAIGRYRCASADDEDDGGIMEVLVNRGSSTEGDGIINAH